MLEPIYQIINHILPFTWLEADFMKRAFLALLFTAPACAAMGVIVVNFKMSFFSDAVSHSAFTGVAIGLLLGIDPFITLVAFGILVGLLVTRIKEKSELPTDTIIGVSFSISVALGIVVVSAKRGLGRILEAFIYGNVLAVGDRDVLIMAAMFLIVMAFLWFSYNKLFLIGINSDMAHTHGINVRFYNYAFAMIVSFVVTISIRIVGILLVTAMLIVPAAGARNVARSIGGMFWLAVIISTFSSIAGLGASYYLDSATGATIILVSGAVFFLTWPVKLILSGIAQTKSN